MSGSSAAFELACEVLELESSLNRLEARGTIRLALKRAGLEVRTVDRYQMQVVVERILADELTARGVDPRPVSAALLRRLLRLPDDGASATAPDAVFRKLGGDA